jgi:methyl-accepting chemotaxis protein
MIKALSKRGIGFKLISMFIVLIMIPVLVLGMISYYRSVTLLESNLKDSYAELIKQTRESIVNYISGIEESVVMMSNDPNVQGIYTNPDCEIWMMKTFKSYVISHKNVSKIFLATKDKKMYIYPEHNYDSSYDPTKRDWYKEAVKQNKLIWTDPYLSASTGELQISASMPVYNKNNGNEFIGVIAISIPLSNLSEKIGNIKVGEKGYVFLADRNLNMLAHPNVELIGQPIPIKEVMEALKVKQEGNVDYSWEEKGEIEEKFSVFSTIEKLGWKIGVISYIDEIEDKTLILLKTTLLVGGIALLLSIIISYFFSNIITKQIGSLVESMEKIKNGDFTIKVDVQSKDEIGTLGKGFNSMTQTLKELVKDVQNVVHQVTSSAESLATTSEQNSASSEEISKTIEEIAKGASEQAADTEKAAGLISNLSNRLLHLSDNSNEMLKYTDSVVQVNNRSIQVVEDLKIKTDLNNVGTKKIEKAITELDNKIKAIGEILETITQISEQTNLLALNASIEAARAGEHGKGFAVVADEIRKLAEESRKSSDRISDIIVSIQQESNNTIEIMDEVKERSNEQSEAVIEVNNSFESILSCVKEMVAKIKMINEGINQINKDKDLIVEAINNISSVSQETAAASEEMTAAVEQQSSATEEVANAAERLKELAEDLNRQVSMFRV